jgi:hypothetical protein
MLTLLIVVIFALLLVLSISMSQYRLQTCRLVIRQIQPEESLFIICIHSLEVIQCGHNLFFFV